MTASRDYADQLELALKELKFIVRGKFAGKENIFDFVWKGLEKEAATLEGLDSHYKIEINGLKAKLEKFCKDKKIATGVLTDKDINILSKLLSLRQILARQLFVLHKLNQFNAEKIFYDLSRLKRDSQGAIDDFKELDVTKKKIFLDELDDVVKKILLTLKEKNFEEDLPDSQPSSALVGSKTPEIIKIKECLIMLPTMNEVAQNPYEEGSEFQEQILDLSGYVAELLEKYEKMLERMGSVKKFIAHRIDDINIEKEIDAYYQWLVKFGMKDNVLADTEKAAKDLIVSLDDKALFGNTFSTLAGASDKLNKLFLVLDKDSSLICFLKKFTSFYSAYIADFDQLTDQKNVLNENKVQIDKACQDVSTQLSNARKRWEQAEEVLERTRIKIDGMVQRHPNTPFFAKHWWKLLIGGVVGCAAAGVTAFFFVPIALTVFSILSVASVVLMGALMGVAIASAISAAIDHCCVPGTSFDKYPGKRAAGRKQNYDDIFESSEEEKTVPEIRPPDENIEKSKIDIKPSVIPVQHEESVQPEPVEIPAKVEPVVLPLTSTSTTGLNAAPAPAVGSWYNPIHWLWKPAPTANPAPTPARLEEGARKTI